jgi:hypothetical protein
MDVVERRTYSLRRAQIIAWMTTFLFKEFMSFFKKLVPSGVFLTNSQLLILDGHGSHHYAKNAIL